jgi:GNAT superfamily N-acetyltransferase
MLVTALNECLYQGYRFRVVMTLERFDEDCRIHDVDLSVSHLALRDGRPVGVTLVGRRGDRAWIAGMGVHPTLRGQGLGTELMRRTHNRLRAAGVRTVFLEVLVENEVARRCYISAGFVAQRRLYCFRGTISRIPWGWRASRVLRRAPADILADYAASHTSNACWQRDLDTLTSRQDELHGLVAVQGRRTVATLLYSKNAVTDVGWFPGGSPLGRPLHELIMVAFGTTRPFAMVNVPNDDPLCEVMHEGGFEVYAEQLDMRFEF